MPLPVDTVIVGSGPSALILSFILSGNEPMLRASTPHPDAQLQAKVSQLRSLFDADVQDLTSHFFASRLSYSTQALPVNTLLDTLIRPLFDTEPGFHDSCVEWKHTGRRINHLVLGSSEEAGGQWMDNPVRASWDIGALSYVELLSLPGYSLEAHLRSKGRKICDFLRPSRREIADYLRCYPEAVGIRGNIRNGTKVTGVRRVQDGFYIPSHDVTCRNLVLASGIFSQMKPVRPALRPLLSLPLPDDSSSSSSSSASPFTETATTDEPPLLVVGSGFTAADLIITHLPRRKVIHIFKWDPEDCVSPLRACHPQAYPEYAAVYRKMKCAARATLGEDGTAAAAMPMPRRKSQAFFEKDRAGVVETHHYEGLPNTWIKDARVENEVGKVTLELPNGEIAEREVSGLEYVIGRRGNLEYLNEDLQREVLGEGKKMTEVKAINARTLRDKVEEEGIEVARGVWAVGSLLGDSLVRHAYGGCVVAAAAIMKRQKHEEEEVVGTRSKVMALRGLKITSEAPQDLSPPQPVAAVTSDARSPDSMRSQYFHMNGHENLWRNARRRLSSRADELEQSKKKRGNLVSECILA